MSSPEIRVTFAALSAAQTDIRTTVDRIHGQLEDLKRYLAPMVSTWTGQAAADYQATQRRWDASAADLADVLHRVGLLVGTANETYQSTEKQNALRWQT